MAYFEYTPPSPIDGPLFGESLATKEPFTSFLRQAQDKRYHYPVCPAKRDHQSSLIQVLGFSERPFIVPHEVLM
jgi:hypothetical protein